MLSFRACREIFKLKDFSIPLRFSRNDKNHDCHFERSEETRFISFKTILNSPQE